MIKLIFFFLLFSFNLFAQVQVEKIILNCGESEYCNDHKERYQSLVSNYKNESHLKNSIKLYLKDGGVQYFDYQYNDKTLVINFEIKPVIKDIQINFKYKSEVTFSKKLLPIKENDFFDQQKLEESVRIIRNNLSERGFIVKDIIPKYDMNADINLTFDVEIEKIKKIKKFVIESENQLLVTFIKQRLTPLIKRAPDLSRIKTLLNEIQEELYKSGYLYCHLKLKEIIKEDDIWVIPHLSLDTGKMYLFSFENFKLFSKPEISFVIRDSVRKNAKVLDIDTIRKIIITMYAKHAYLDIKLDIKELNYTDKVQKEIRHFYLKVHEGSKRKFKEVGFIGNSFFSHKVIKKLFYSKATDLASRNYFDEDYLNSFTDILKNEYLKNGFVQVEISQPIVGYRDNKIIIEYKINEFEQTFVRDVVFNGVNEEIKLKLEGLIQNTKGNIFNPLVLNDDIKNVQNYLRSLGYYYSEIKNVEGNKLLIYSDDNADLSINYDIQLNEEIKLDKIIVIGNLQTRPIVITREIDIKKDDIVTPDKIDQIKNALSNLGLFSSVKVTPLREAKNNDKVDLLINVKEKSFGTVEVAPGYRTDLGPKISTGVTYNNIGGMNRTASLRAQVNKRVNGSTLDPRRRAQNKENWEYNVKTSFTEPYFLGSTYSYTGGLSAIRRRFYSFDADIVRLNNTFSKEFSRWFTASLTHQYETINQFDSSNSIDNGYFQIGAIIPSITFDFRDNRANPLKGAFINYSIENAAPEFLSQKQQDLTIKYYKMVNRNNFYIPLDKYGVIAVAASWGKQKNLADNGYIPNIKVFRLSGVDIVRGFDNSEINRLPNGLDMSSMRVGNEAYFLNFKFEPRYFIDDESMVGFFVDAGRVYVESLQPSDLRKSAGLSFRYLTPVGALSFDYGFKLDRKTYPDGTKEDPGRFHISIGFF